MEATVEQQGHSSWIYGFVKIVNAMIKFLGLVSSFALGVMILIIVVNVMGRYLFKRPLTGSIELVELLSVVVVFFAVAYTQLMRVHVTVDVLTMLMPRKVQGILASIMCFLGGLFFLTLALQGTVLGLADVSPILRSTAILSVPIAPFEFVMAIGAFLLGIKMLLDCFLTGVSGAESKDGSKT
ncbi:TRAP transporter small permease [Thermodesulfobacteriota bacterium]